MTDQGTATTQTRTPAQVLIPDSTAPASASQIQIDELRPRLRKQLEHYFSPSNLQKDQFLVSKMNTDGYVPLALVAGFRLVQSLTSDVKLIVDAVSSSTLIELDATATLVRAKPAIPVQRSVIMLRETVPSSTPIDDVKRLFGDQFVPTDVHPDVNDTWFISFESEKTAQDALQFVRTQSFNGRSVNARFKSRAVAPSPYSLAAPAPAFSLADAYQQQAFALNGSFPPVNFIPSAVAPQFYAGSSYRRNRPRGVQYSRSEDVVPLPYSNAALPSGSAPGSSQDVSALATAALETPEVPVASLADQSLAPSAPTSEQATDPSHGHTQDEHRKDGARHRRSQGDTRRQHDARTKPKVVEAPPKLLPEYFPPLSLAPKVAGPKNSAWSSNTRITEVLKSSTVAPESPKKQLSEGEGVSPVTKHVATSAPDAAHTAHAPVHDASASSSHDKVTPASAPAERAAASTHSSSKNSEWRQARPTNTTRGQNATSTRHTTEDRESSGRGDSGRRRGGGGKNSGHGRGSVRQEGVAVASVGDADKRSYAATLRTQQSAGNPQTTSTQQTTSTHTTQATVAAVPLQTPPDAL